MSARVESGERARMVTKNRVVKLEYALEVDGEIIDETLAGEPLLVLWGHAHALPPGLEEALEGYPRGEFQVSVPAERGVGSHRHEKVSQARLADFPEGSTVEVGKEFLTRDGEGHPVGARVTAVDGEEVTVDANSRLAGKTLVYSGLIHDIQEATAEEIEHGHVHGEGGVEH